DGTADVYDARVPRPGDNPPPAALPCEGAVCQGPPSVPQLLGAPASETFSGLGNVPPSTVATKSVAKGKSAHKPTKKHVKRKRKKARRALHHNRRRK
ncbi:MAG: hypothetical protein FWD42_08290, partial [Solirubrobacterales bacterium]|nr:hypothetical protein [Solirubrobacterales bacterium]